jgi:hypothetical protein
VTTTEAAVRPPLSWDQFRDRLATALAAMGDETFLILELPQDELGQRGFVQFANWLDEDDGSTGFRAEAIGSLHLPEERKLTPEQFDRLAALGWALNEGVDKDDNLWHEWGLPVPGGEVAAVAVTTLREAYGAMHPAELTYKYGSFGSEQVGPLDLGIRQYEPATRPGSKPQMRPAGRPLEPIIEEGLRKWFPLGGLVRDGDGDYPIPVVTDVDPSPGLFLALNDLNKRIRFARVFWSGGAIILATELPAVDITADQIAFACMQMGGAADHLDDVLNGQFGGGVAMKGRTALVN